MSEEATQTVETQTGDADPTQEPAQPQDPAPEVAPADGEGNDGAGEGDGGDADPNPGQTTDPDPADDADDLGSVLDNREGITRSEKTSLKKWDTAMDGDDLDPQAILDLSSDALLMKTADQKAKEWGYESAEEMIAEAKEAISAKPPAPDPKPQSTETLSKEEIEFIREQRKAKQNEAVQAKAQALKDEETSYKEWEPEAIKTLSKHGISEDAFRANHQTDFRARRNELVKTGLNLVEAGKHALNEIKIQAIESEDEGAGDEEPNLELPAKSSTTPKSGDGAPKKVTRDVYMAMSVDAKENYVKYHKKNGVLQYAQ